MVGTGSVALPSTGIGCIRESRSTNRKNQRVRSAERLDGLNDTNHKSTRRCPGGGNQGGAELLFKGNSDVSPCQAPVSVRTNQCLQGGMGSEGKQGPRNRVGPCMEGVTQLLRAPAAGRKFLERRRSGRS